MRFWRRKDRMINFIKMLSQKYVSLVAQFSIYLKIKEIICIYTGHYAGGYKCLKK